MPTNEILYQMPTNEILYNMATDQISVKAHARKTIYDGFSILFDLAAANNGIQIPW